VYGNVLLPPTYPKRLKTSSTPASAQSSRPSAIAKGRVISWISVLATCKKLNAEEILVYRQQLIASHACMQAFDALYKQLDEHQSTQSRQSFANLTPAFCELGKDPFSSDAAATAAVALLEHDIYTFSQRHMLRGYDEFGSARALLFTGEVMEIRQDDRMSKDTRFVWVTILTHLLRATVNDLTETLISDTFFMCAKYVGDEMIQFCHFLLVMQSLYDILPDYLVAAILQFLYLVETRFGGVIPPTHIMHF